MCIPSLSLTHLDPALTRSSHALQVKFGLGEPLEGLVRGDEAPLDVVLAHLWERDGQVISETSTCDKRILMKEGEREKKNSTWL